MTLIGLLTACLSFNSFALSKQEMGTVINLAGKQRMLTQKMSKEILLVANGIDVDANKANLHKTVALFGRTLNGLFGGDQELGLPGTKDPAIRAQLEVVQKLWAEYKPVRDKVDTSPGGLAKAAKLNLPLLKEMNKAVKMYEKSANQEPVRELGP